MDIVQTCFFDMMAECGFKRRMRTFYCERDGLVIVVNLQKSSYGPSYYVNIAAFLGTIEGRGFLPEAKCDIRTRLTQIISTAKAEMLSRALDMDYELPEHERCASIRAEVGPIVDQLMVCFENIDAARKCLSDTGKKFFVNSYAKSRLFGS